MHHAVKNSPIRVKVEKDTPRIWTWTGSNSHPLHVGCGDECDIKIGKEPGPAILFELRPTEGPIQLFTPLDPKELDRHVELTVDGERLKDTSIAIARGSHLNVFDKATKQRYRLQVEPLSFWSRHLRFILPVLFIAVAVSIAVAVYLYSRIERTESRLSSTEQHIIDAEVLINEIKQTTASAQLALSDGLRQLEELNQSTVRGLRNEFDQRHEKLVISARAQLGHIAEGDKLARKSLEERTTANIEELRAEFAGKMVDSYQRHKIFEDRMLTEMAKRFDAIQPESDVFKTVFASARPALMFIRTEFDVAFTGREEATTMSSFGTGFVINDKGVGLSAQHVMFPWHYDEQFAAMHNMGIANLVPDSVRWYFWRTGETVITDQGSAPQFNTTSAYRNELTEKAIYHWYSPPLVKSKKVVASPIGMLEVDMPLPGASDIAVFQLMDFTTDHATIPLPERQYSQDMMLEQLDEVLAIGYPFAGLENGVALPQAVRGFVRRNAGTVLELDIALHPGFSGGPVVNRSAKTVGMAVGVLGTSAYGMAIQHQDLSDALDKARSRIRLVEERLSGTECDPGMVDGVIDEQAWRAIICDGK